MQSKELDSIKKAEIPGASVTGGPNDIHVLTLKVVSCRFDYHLLKVFKIYRIYTYMYRQMLKSNEGD